MLLDRGEKTLERFDAATVQGLIVFHQQLHGAFAQDPGEGLQVAGVGEVTEGHLQPIGAEGLGALQGGDQLRIGFRLAGQPQFHRRGIHAFEALRLGGIGQLGGVFNGQQFFAPFDVAGARSCEDIDEMALTALADEVGAVAGEADGNGWFMHCHGPLKPVSFLFKKKDEVLW
ncbi:hypothetical protein D3C84_933550 [compost metagenome]